MVRRNVAAYAVRRTRAAGRYHYASLDDRLAAISDNNATSAQPRASAGRSASPRLDHDVRGIVVVAVDCGFFAHSPLLFTPSRIQPSTAYRVNMLTCCFTVLCADDTVNGSLYSVIAVSLVLDHVTDVISVDCKQLQNTDYDIK